jgi:hypothetical protein
MSHTLNVHYFFSSTRMEASEFSHLVSRCVHKKFSFYCWCCFYVLRLKEKQLEIHCLKHFDPFCFHSQYLTYNFLLFLMLRSFFLFSIHEMRFWKWREKNLESFFCSHYFHSKYLCVSWRRWWRWKRVIQMYIMHELWWVMLKFLKDIL